MAKRLNKEAQDLASSGLEWCSAEPVDGNFFHWNAVVIGPEDTPYAGGVFNLDFAFPPTYPFKPPEVKFVTKIYHPSVKTDSGEICADILTSEWSPTLNVKWVLTAIRSLMEDPSADSPLEPEIGNLLMTDKPEFEKKAAEFTKTFAT